MSAPASSASVSFQEIAPRKVIHITRGQRSGGPITRLMSPSDLGRLLKPFVFLDIFDATEGASGAMRDMPLHPHSGIATVTVFTEGSMRYHDPAAGSGALGYGGVEWMRAGGGVWHGKELSAADVPRIQGFQLWLALPPELENAEPMSCYLEARNMRSVGPAHVIVGNLQGVRSPVPAPAGINYLLVTLKPGERWVYLPPVGHTVGWVAVAKGALDSGALISSGEMAVLESGEKPVALESAGQEDAVFVLGSAIPHPFALHLGSYSVHTSVAALEAGERRIEELYRKLSARAPERHRARA